MANTIEAVYVSNPENETDTASHITITHEQVLLIRAMKEAGNHVFQCWVKANANKTIKFICDSNEKTVNVTTAWQKVEWFFKTESTSDIKIKFPVGQYWFYNTKLEKGNKATDWSPAPEDFDKNLADSVNRVQVGGRNYIILGKLGAYTPYNTTPICSGNVITTTFNPTSTEQRLCITVDGVNLANEICTLSGYIKVDGVIPSECFFTGGITNLGGTAVINKKYDSITGYFEITQRYSSLAEQAQWTIHAPTRHVIGASEVITFEKLKLEKGTRATDWAPAPEDVENAIDNNTQKIVEAESNIEQLSTQISTLVQDGSGKSLMTQTATGWTFSMGDFEEALNNLLAHIKIGYYNNQPCLELVVDDAKQKLMLTNTDIRFMESDTTAAYITGNIMNIDNAKINNTFSVVRYEFALDDDDTLNILYE